VSYIIILIFFSGVVWNKINYKLCSDHFSPFNLLYFSWILPILLMQLQLSEFETSWEPRSIIAIIWVSIALIFTSILPFFVIRITPILNRNTIFSITRSLFQDNLFKIIIVILFVIIFPLYIYSEFVTNPVGIPLVSVIQGQVTDIGALHRWAKDTRWQIITPTLFILTPMLYMIFKCDEMSRIRYMYLFFSLLYPAMGFLKLSRSDIFIGALNIVFIEYYYRKYRIRRLVESKLIGLKYGLLFLCAIMIASVTLYFRMGMDTSTNIYASAIRFKYEDPTIINNVFAEIYGYFALPFENFHRFFESYDEGFNLGISAFRPLFSILGYGYVADEMINNISYEPLGGAAGSATFLTFIYGEIGIYGLVFIPLIYGLIVNILYIRFRYMPNYINMFLYMNFVYPWLWLFFNNAFSALTFYLNAMAIIMIFICYEYAKCHFRVKNI